MDEPGAVDSTDNEKNRPENVFSGYRLLWWPAIAVVLLVHIVAFTAFLRSLGLLVTPFYGFTKTLAFAASFLVAAIVLRLVLQRWMGEGVAPKWSLNSGSALVGVAELSLILVTIGLLTVAYSWPKVMVQVLNPRLWDAQLVALDRLLCLGVDPNEFLLTVFEGSPAWISFLLDRYYHAFVLTQSMGAAWFLCDPRARFRSAFGAGFIALWMIGTWCYVAVPAVGPAYFFEDLPQRLWVTFPAAAQGQAALHANYMAVQGLASGKQTLIVPHFGIAAMPSLHVGIHLFLYLWSVFAKSRLRPVFLAMTLLTFVGSVATGWHYVVDGLAGAFIAAVAFFLAVVAAKLLRDTGAPSKSAPQSYNP
jgi:hypothetical protein